MSNCSIIYNLRYVPEGVKSKEICLTAVSSYGIVLKFVPTELKDDEICHAAIINDVNALRYVI